MRVRNLCAALATLTASALVSLPAFADCAPNDWFCDESKAKPSSPPPSTGPNAQGDEQAPPETRPPDAATERGDGDSGPSPPVVHEPSHKTKTATPSKVPEPKRRFGLNAHANFALSGNDPNTEDSFLRGPGVAFRFRPMDLIGMDSGLDFAGGNDWNGDERLETALLVHALLFINPLDRIELHVLAGFGASLAYVRERQPGGDTPLRHYWYFGGDTGFGLEWFLTKRVTLGLEALALVRQRNDDSGTNPEFVDPTTHRATSLSVGGLIRPGVTIYW